MSTQTNSQHLLTQTQSDSQVTIDKTVVYDTVHQIVLETLWREPDSVGKIYPQLTTRTEFGAARQTQANVVTQTHDTIYINEATKTSEQNETDIRAPTTTATLLPWLIILGMIVIAIVILAIRIILK